MLALLKKTIKNYGLRFLALLAGGTVVAGWSIFLVALTFVAFVRVASAFAEGEISPATPPTNDKLFNLIFRGINTAGEYAIRTDSANATPEAVFATDLTAAQQNDSYTQETLIRNTSADISGTGTLLCVKGIPWNSAGGATCQLKCAAATISCNNGANDGKHVPPGTELNRVFDGTNCVCASGDGGGTAYQSERLLR